MKDDLTLEERMACWERAWQGMVEHITAKLTEEDARASAQPRSHDATN